MADIITLDMRWTRVRQPDGNWEWDQVRCFRFTDPVTGRVSWADILGPEQGAEFDRQQAERKETSNG